jgi:ATP-dependent DNA ligase
MIHIDRPKFKEIRYEEAEVWSSAPEIYDTVEIKMDGIWGAFSIDNGDWAITSRTGKIKAEGEHPCAMDTTILLGEYMHGSHWGHKMDIDGQFFAFDCLMFQGEDIKDHSLQERRGYLSLAIESYDLPPFIHILPNYEVNMWPYLWEKHVKGEAYEGLVFKNGSSKYNDKGAWARMKDTVEIEYICHSFRPADVGTRYEGQVGAVIGTLHDKEVYVTCGGLTDSERLDYTENPTDYIGKVFTAKGNSWFPSGSIRHPKFKSWRDDKQPEECTYNQIPEVLR